MSGSKFSPISIEQKDNVVTIGLNSPPYNPISTQTVERLESLLLQIKEDNTVRVAVIQGAGDRSFSVGADLKEFSKGVLDMDAVIRKRLDVFRLIEHLGKPVIAAICGYCLGGGLELALSCHFRLAAENARLGLPEINLGTAPSWGGGQRLLRLVGRSEALNLLLRGHQIDGMEALRIGLVNQVHGDDGLKDAAQLLAVELSEKSPLTVSTIMDYLMAGEDMPLAEALAFESKSVRGLVGTKDNVEGISAFLEKRKPVFTGE